MANPNYYYQGYQPMMGQQMVPNNPVMVQPPVQNQQNNNSIIWCQGEAGAKAYPVAPNNSVLLMDSENSVMYIKSADGSGMPLPLRIFDYTERTAQTSHNAVSMPQTDVVTREEFERLREDVTRLSRGIRQPTVTKKQEKGE